ncbi:hypothetical protein SAMN05421827_104117 [Pedobacter terrae]|uniref:Uncharacterized protein n=1 Tax=Pedobacter terrae TaxID=405671 RepID=A0A1G7SE44_9SPHI|nr:hypothetical protein SAMN05421827_104117 [Pedobacter terrae]
MLNDVKQMLKIDVVFNKNGMDHPNDNVNVNNRIFLSDINASSVRIIQ